MITPIQETLDTIHRSLRLESVTFGRTLLLGIHCPDRFLVQEAPSINTFLGGDLTVATEEEESFIPEGAAIIIPAGIPRRFTNHNPGKTVSLWHHIRFSILDTIDPLTLLSMPNVIDAELGERVREINQALFDAGALRTANFLRYITTRHALALELFNIVLSVSTLKPDAQERLTRAGRLLPALQYIKENLADRIYTEDLANVLHVSEPRLFELFREAIGLAPGKYVQQQRMRRAQDLLINTDMRIGEVAETIGYDDQFHFSRLFKKNFGVSPDMFRKQWQPSE